MFSLFRLSLTRLWFSNLENKVFFLLLFNQENLFLFDDKKFFLGTKKEKVRAIVEQLAKGVLILIIISVE